MSSETKAGSPTNPLVFKWTDPNASITKRMIAAIAVIIFFPFWLFGVLMWLAYWVLYLIAPWLFPNLESNVPALAQSGGEKTLTKEENS